MLHANNTADASQSVEPAFYRLADIIRITALSRSSIYLRIAAGDFPAQVPLGNGRAKGAAAGSLAGVDRRYSRLPAVDDVQGTEKFSRWPSAAGGSHIEQVRCCYYVFSNPP